MDESISPQGKNTLKGIRLAARITGGIWLGIGLIYTSMLTRLSQLVFCEVRILQLDNHNRLLFYCNYQYFIK